MSFREGPGVCRLSADGYALTDRGTWVHFRDRRDLKIVVEDDPRLFNQYAVILVNPARYPQVKAEMGMAFIDWLTATVPVVWTASGEE